jgi:Fe-S-cluster-containing dehydrogenase component
MSHDRHPTRLNRRDLLKLGGAGAASLLLAPSKTCAAEQPPSDEATAMLYDATLCVGCRSCVLACRGRNGHPVDSQPPQELSADTWTVVKQFKAGGESSFRKVQCMHCIHPGCVSVCTVGALRKTAAGPVIYDAGKCIGCRYCQYGCPFGVPRFEWDKALSLIGKCDFCADRLADGLSPACAEACPVGALTVGTRAQMIEEAYGRLKANPGRYVEHVYGESEGGGTSLLILSSVTPGQLGLPELGPEPVTQGSTTVMNATPTVITLLVPILGGIYWLSRKPEDSEVES